MDYKIKDINQAEFVEKKFDSRVEMPGLMAQAHTKKPLSGANIIGCLHDYSNSSSN